MHEFVYRSSKRICAPGKTIWPQRKLLSSTPLADVAPTSTIIWIWMNMYNVKVVIFRSPFDEPFAIHILLSVISIMNNIMQYKNQITSVSISIAKMQYLIHVCLLYSCIAFCMFCNSLVFQRLFASNVYGILTNEPLLGQRDTARENALVCPSPIIISNCSWVSRMSPWKLPCPCSILYCSGSFSSVTTPTRVYWHCSLNI